MALYSVITQRPPLPAKWKSSFLYLLLRLPEKSDPSSTKQDCLQTSVLRDNMEQRISRLGQYINEAQWRFQLVSWNSGTNNHKTTRNSRKRLSRKLQVIASSDELRRRAEEAQGEDSHDTEGRAGKDCLLCDLFFGDAQTSPKLLTLKTLRVISFRFRLVISTLY